MPDGVLHLLSLNIKTPLGFFLGTGYLGKEVNDIQDI